MEVIAYLLAFVARTHAHCMARNSFDSAFVLITGQWASVHEILFAFFTATAIARFIFGVLRDQRHSSRDVVMFVGVASGGHL